MLIACHDIMASNLELHAIKNIVLVCSNHMCGVFFDDKPDLPYFQMQNSTERKHQVL